MQVELLVTGDEIVSGSVTDTNSSWLLQRLLALGVRARRVTAVGDERSRIEEALREAAARSSLVVVSGGLGPTSDDLTAECAAHVAGVPLVLDQGTLERVLQRWALRNRPMPPGVERQALVPQGSRVLANDEGTAPGFHLRLGHAECFFFAGVPREFRHLCEQHLLPFIQSHATRTVKARTLRCIGLPESELDALVQPVASAHGLRLGLRAVYPEAWATFYSEAPQEEQARQVLAQATAQALQILGHRCYSSDDESLAGAVGRLLVQSNSTLAVAESCTGGLLGAALTDVPGSSRYFVGGVLSYANEEKTRALGVPPELFRTDGAVSEPVARAMAEGARTRIGTTYALSITGVAGPGGGTPAKPVGTVWVALATPSSTRTELLRVTRTDRESIRLASVASALDLLRRELLGGV